MKKKLFSLLFIMIGMLGIINVEAASTTIGDTSEATSLPISRVVSSVKDKVNNTFTYAISQDEGNPEIVTGLPSSATIQFNNVTPDFNLAEVDYNLDLSNVTFTKVGDYRFTIQEIESSDDKTYPIDEVPYHFYVYVRNEVDSNSVPTGNLVATLVTTGVRDDFSDKENIIFNNYAFSYFTLTKTVKGDLADVNEYFKYHIIVDASTVFCEGCAIAVHGTISGQDSTVTYKGQTIQTSNVLAPNMINPDTYVYLKSGQTATIGITQSEAYEIPCGVSFTIVEEDADDYKTYINQSNNDSKEISFKLSNVSENNSITYENVKESSSLTGVLVNSIPFVVLFGVTIVGIILVRKKVRV